MTLTEVEIDHARRVRSPDTKAAIRYLEASGATAITITEHDGIASFHIGGKIDPRAVSVQWLPQMNAQAVVKLARRHAGASPDAAQALAALHRAAADQRVTLTPHDVAMTRAGDAAGRIEQYIDSMRAKGAMREFTRAYRRRRTEAAPNGQGFITYAVAEARLRRALIPLLVGGKQANAQSLFVEIFDR
jgi:hypothetical protein